ncbi:hypothetical protein [Rhodobacter aestuarii]|uniref:hypothetical protein n=1 Tax=Rhodobacter aestuarii TaxID=453582 RepID=UPI000970E968|nr:hypothetical protein [Rhodobacter aestuarii]
MTIERLAVAFVAAGFEEAQFWRLTLRAYRRWMRGAEERRRQVLLHHAEATRAGSLLGEEAYRSWVAAVRGAETRLPEEALGGVLARAGAQIEQISLAEALGKMGAPAEAPMSAELE